MVQRHFEGQFPLPHHENLFKYLRIHICGDEILYRDIPWALAGAAVTLEALNHYDSDKTMPSQVGDLFPNVDLWVLEPAHSDNKPRQPVSVRSWELVKGKRRVIFVGIPGPFTPGCSKSHVPGFIETALRLQAKGIDDIYVISTADAFVMDAFARTLGTDKQRQPLAITFLADGNHALTKALDMELDGSARGMGMRMQRFAMVVNGDGVIEDLLVDPSGHIKFSRAENVLSRL